MQTNNLSLNQRIGLGILCALEVYQEESFIDWAEKWLSDEDRSKESAQNMTNRLALVFDKASEQFFIKLLLGKEEYVKTSYFCASYSAYSAAYAAFKDGLDFEDAIDAALECNCDIDLNSFIEQVKSIQ